MNKGTKGRTILRVIFSIYSGFCVWEATIKALGEQLGIEWLAVICTVIIVASGLLVDILTTYFNNDYTKEACEGTGLTRQRKAENKSDYEGERFFEEVSEEVSEDEEA